MEMFLQGPLTRPVGRLTICDKPHRLVYPDDLDGERTQAYKVYMTAIANWRTVYKAAMDSENRARIENAGNDVIIHFEDGSGLVFAC